jgi:hypothetical protein
MALVQSLGGVSDRVCRQLTLRLGKKTYAGCVAEGFLMDSPTLLPGYANRLRPGFG